MNEEKRKIIISAAISLVSILGGIVYLIYNIETNQTQTDIQLSYWAIAFFVSAFFLFPVKDYVKYKKKVK